MEACTGFVRRVQPGWGRIKHDLVTTLRLLFE